MMGRAGRPQFDDQGKAVILVHDIKKHFYKKFLYEPFPVESRSVHPASAGPHNSQCKALPHSIIKVSLFLRPAYVDLASRQNKGQLKMGD